MRNVVCSGMRRAGPLLALLAVALLLSTSGASAARAWCQSDPVVKIDGGVADVFLSSYTDLNLSATGPVTLVIALPVGSVGELLATDNGFGGLGYKVSFVTDSTLKRTNGITQVRIQAYAPAADTTLPLDVNFSPRSSNLRAASANGSVDTYWVTVNTR